MFEMTRSSMFVAIVFISMQQSDCQIVLPALPSPLLSLPELAPFKLLLSENEEALFKTSTETIPLAVPIPVPMAVQIAVPAAPGPQFCKGKPCPACPPCLCAPACTPAFYSYCSSCHQKCRCRSINDVPEPLPLTPPLPLNSPVFSLPVSIPLPNPEKILLNPFQWYNSFFGQVIEQI